jgi:outer membrane protein assembly factor BamE (lipoprotein component of BamABCDE complex)
MKKSIIAACVIGSTIMLSACSTTGGLSELGAYKVGTQVTVDQMGQIHNNVSTQADVVALIGHPNRQSEVNGKEIWYYDFSEVGQPFIGHNVSEASVFEFKHGVVVSHYKSGNGNQSSNPLLKAAGM